ncbi:hypothetical protein F2Q69_00049268 [Brassica cretica]|uniref:Uncharacterized protein n=1 Tax=Brassica cretica TaxID=69181 RepID=A0A8S9PLG7_BRACR|nr:hypothetical protein F2Q69_00049268 [Brassica cretica]
MLAPDALELEEEQWMKQEETMCYCALLQVPLLRASPNVEVKDKELVVSYPAKENDTLAEHMVRNQHLPSGITVESFGILELCTCVTLWFHICTQFLRSSCVLVLHFGFITVESFGNLL